MIVEWVNEKNTVRAPESSFTVPASPGVGDWTSITPETAKPGLGGGRQRVP